MTCVLYLIISKVYNFLISLLTTYFLLFAGMFYDLTNAGKQRKASLGSLDAFDVLPTTHFSPV